MESCPILTFKEFKAMINQKKFDKYNDLPVIVSGDDEGNSYDRILYSPTPMTNVEINNDFGVTFKKAICIN